MFVVPSCMAIKQCTVLHMAILYTTRQAPIQIDRDVMECASVHSDPFCSGLFLDACADCCVGRPCGPISPFSPAC